MNQQITLNIRYDIPDEEWEKIGEVYRSMDGWLDGQEYPYWYGTESDPRYISASVEPGGIQFCGEIEPDIWVGWLTVLCAKLTQALGREIHDAEM
ncbi:hypothetical protein [Denitromonas sp.]|uniref:hypothetical protein n=1 Tax=Denitromonas sp. TaxID=2734609 RepID=UPI003A8C84C6